MMFESGIAEFDGDIFHIRPVGGLMPGAAYQMNDTLHDPAEGKQRSSGQHDPGPGQRRGYPARHVFGHFRVLHDEPSEHESGD